MSALDTLLATQQPANILGAVNQGFRNNNLNQTNALNLQQAQAQAPQRNRLLDFQVEQQAQKVQANDEESKIKLIQKTAAFIGDITDQAEFEARIDQAPFLDAEAKANAKKFGAQGVRDVAAKLGDRIGRQGASPTDVQSSKILADGSIVQSLRGGGSKIIKASDVGKSVVAEAAKTGVDDQLKRSQARQVGKDSASVSGKAFTQVANIRSNINNLREVITTVGDGAETGPLVKKLPSFRAESVRLDNIRSRLGLDIIGSVTFGALSEGELQLALDTALPTGLDGPELVDWAKQKISAQEKLADYLEEQAIFLGKPGNTISSFLESKQQAQAPQVAVAQQALPQGVTEDDITETMRANNMTREQVLQRLQQ